MPRAQSLNSNAASDASHGKEVVPAVMEGDGLYPDSSAYGARVLHQGGDMAVPESGNEALGPRVPLELPSTGEGLFRRRGPGAVGDEGKPPKEGRPSL